MHMLLTKQPHSLAVVTLVLLAPSCPFVSLNPCVVSCFSVDCKLNEAGLETVVWQRLFARYHQVLSVNPVQLAMEGSLQNRRILSCYGSSYTKLTFLVMNMARGKGARLGFPYIPPIPCFHC